MVSLGRKFFFFSAVCIPLLACALPNFAALAPTPTVQQDSESLEPTLVVAIQPQSTVNIDSPKAVTQLVRPQLPNKDLNSNYPANLIAGNRYQIRESTTLNYLPQANRNIIFTLSAGGDLTLLDSEGNLLSDIVTGDSKSGSYALASQALTSPIQIDVDIEKLSDERDYLVLSVEDLAQSDFQILSTSGTITGDVLERVEVEAVSGQPFIAFLEPSLGLDSVLELYGPEGHVTTLDENGVGEVETLVYTPDQSGTWVFTIFGYQDSAGEFELTVIQLPQ